MELQLNLYHAGYEACAPRHSFGPAVRTHYVLHFILSGKGWYRRGENAYRLESNSIFLICPGEVTYYEADPEDPWEYCWIGFDGSHAADILAACGLQNTPAQTVSEGQARETMRTISDAYIHNRGNAVFYTGLLYQFFSYLMEQPELDRPTAARVYWATAAEHIQKNYMYDITVGSAAAFVGVDRSYLYRLFQLYQGQSPQQYLLQCRVEGAKRLLRETEYTVTEIAYSCGFKDVATFGRAFHSLTGTSPSVFRKQVRKELGDHFL